MQILLTTKDTREGFLPQKKGRATRLAALKDEPRTMIFYESPHRVVRALTEMAATFGDDRRCSVCREISKLHLIITRIVFFNCLQLSLPMNRIHSLLALCLFGLKLFAQSAMELKQQSLAQWNIGSAQSSGITHLGDNRYAMQRFPLPEWEPTGRYKRPRDDE